MGSGCGVGQDGGLDAKGEEVNSQPKPRHCEVCQTLYTPARMGQRVCSVPCATKSAKKARKEAVEAARMERMRDRARKDDFRKITYWIALTQKVFNEYIRERDKHKGCFVCGRPFADVPGQVQHAGHVRSRGAAGHLRFNEDNCMGECEGCNGPHGAKPHEIKAGAIARIGVERWEALENDNTPHKWTREELAEIRDRYKAKLKDLRKAQDSA